MITDEELELMLKNEDSGEALQDVALLVKELRKLTLSPEEAEDLHTAIGVAENEGMIRTARAVELDNAVSRAARRSPE